jgi:hypothetical protein
MRQEFSVVEEDDRRATNYYIKNCLAGGSSPPRYAKISILRNRKFHCVLEIGSGGELCSMFNNSIVSYLLVV